MIRIGNRYAEWVAENRCGFLESDFVPA